MLISLRLDPSGTYLQRLLENYLCEDLYILPFEEKDNKFVFRSEGIKISMNYNCKKTGPIISITMHINGIFYKKEKSRKYFFPSRDFFLTFYLEIF